VVRFIEARPASTTCAIAHVRYATAGEHSFADTARELWALGAANFLYSDGDVLFLHAHKRRWDEGGGRFSEPRAPGLSIATLDDLLIEGLHVEAPHDQTDIAFVASVPLSEEGWQPLPEGTVAALQGGRMIAQRAA
jgi:glutamine amidotransferase